MMKLLQDILTNVKVDKIAGPQNPVLQAIAFDSRKVKKNTLFVALKGVQTDGHLFISKAIEAGANIILCEQMPQTILPAITYVKLDNTAKALALLAANFYDHPSEKLKLVGITGTNGKTTLATLSYELFKMAGYKVGLLSTINIKIDEEEYPATHTTPDVLTINEYLSKMVEAGVSHCFMEVSSHGIAQDRITALHFAGGVFTNLSHDHLDYHASFAEYRDVKKKFFDELPKDAFALVNIDDKNGSVMLQNTKAQAYTYSLKTTADYKVKIIENRLEGLLLNINGREVATQLIGKFNAYNLCAIYGIARLLGLESLEVLQYISLLKSAAGRFQYFISKNGVITIVDYAHTPDALINVLQTIREIKQPSQQVVTIVGCGGDRDKDKRPKMGHIATQLSEQSIFTSDNPRTEDPQLIIEEMEKGVTDENIHKYLSILDRKQAIKTAAKLCNQNDVLLIAGKGHETYQEINGKRYDFDDLLIAKEILNP